MDFLRNCSMDFWRKSSSPGASLGARQGFFLWWFLLEFIRKILWEFHQEFVAKFSLKKSNIFLKKRVVSLLERAIRNSSRCSNAHSSSFSIDNSSIVNSSKKCIENSFRRSFGNSSRSCFEIFFENFRKNV